MRHDTLEPRRRTLLPASSSRLAACVLAIALATAACASDEDSAATETTAPADSTVATTLAVTESTAPDVSTEKPEPVETAAAETVVSTATTENSAVASTEGSEPTIPVVEHSAFADATPSAGCSGNPMSPGTHEVTQTSSGVERQYTLTVAPGADPLPLIVGLHGYGGHPRTFESFESRLGAFGPVLGFHAIVPFGAGDPPHWETAADSVDMQFINDLLDEAERTVCIDVSRVYVTGMSNGAMMSSAIGCQLPDRVAAIAPVGGIQEPQDCPGRPVPVIAFHGTADTFITFDGSPATDRPEGLEDVPASPTTPVPDRVAAWAEFEGCDAEPVTTAIAEDVDLLDYTCSDETDLQFYVVGGGGHNWPGNELAASVEDRPQVRTGHVTLSISATELMWAFFQRFQLP